MPASYSASHTGQNIGELRWLKEIFRCLGLPVHRPLKRYLFKVCHSFECSEAIVDFSMRQPPYSIRSEFLNVERRHDGTKNHRAAHRRLVQCSLAGKISHESSSERIAGACWIKYRLQWICWDGKVTLTSKQRRTIFATFHNQCLGSPRENLTRRLDQIRDPG